jgi:hypothetical protein
MDLEASHETKTRRKSKSKVERFMQTQPVTVAPSLSLRDLVDDFISRANMLDTRTEIHT